MISMGGACGDTSRPFSFAFLADRWSSKVTVAWFFLGLMRS